MNEEEYKMLKKSALPLLIIVIICIAVLVAGCTGTTGQSKSGPPTVSGGPLKAPELVVPASVSGFTQELKYDHEQPMFQDEEYLATGLYKPEFNSTYEGNVAYLAVIVDKFVNSTAAARFYEEINGTPVTVSGYSGKYNYDPDMGMASVVVSHSDLIIGSSAQAPENMTPFDENLLRNAAISGTAAALRNL
jgi:hypothetical protein